MRLDTTDEYKRGAEIMDGRGMKRRCHMAGLLLLRAWNSWVHGLRWLLLSTEKQGDDMDGWKDGIKTDYEICFP